MTTQSLFQGHPAQSLNAGLALVLLTACTRLPRNPIAVEDIRRAEISGMTGVCAWAAKLNPVFRQ